MGVPLFVFFLRLRSFFFFFCLVVVVVVPDSTFLTPANSALGQFHHRKEDRSQISPSFMSSQAPEKPFLGRRNEGACAHEGMRSGRSSLHTAAIRA
ncbi:hypothetical protein IWX49DRAFT_564592 [Phyllosticta citricarpa]